MVFVFILEIRFTVNILSVMALKLRRDYRRMFLITLMTFLSYPRLNTILPLHVSFAPLRTPSTLFSNWSFKAVCKDSSASYFHSALRAGSAAAVKKSEPVINFFFFVPPLFNDNSIIYYHKTIKMSFFFHSKYTPRSRHKPRHIISAGADSLGIRNKSWQNASEHASSFLILSPTMHLSTYSPIKIFFYCEIFLYRLFVAPLRDSLLFVVFYTTPRWLPEHRIRNYMKPIPWRITKNNGKANLTLFYNDTFLNPLKVTQIVPNWCY